MRLKWPALGGVILVLMVASIVWLFVRRKKYFGFDPFVTIGRVLAAENIILFISFATFIFFTTILAARPQKLYRLTENKSLSDVYILLDVSGSMNILTGAGNTRLDIAKRALMRLLGSLPRERFRIGFIIFIDYPLLQIPLTRDYELIKERIKLADQMDLPLLPDSKTGGTDIAQAIMYAVVKLAQLQPPDYTVSKAPKNKRGAIIVITDGEQTVTSKYTLDEAASLAAKYHVKVYPIIVNSLKAHSAIEQAQQVATITAGKAFFVDRSEEFLKVVDEIANLEKKRIKTPSKNLYYDSPEAFMLGWFLSLIILMAFKIRLNWG